MKKLSLITSFILLFSFALTCVSYCDVDPRSLVILANSDSPRSVEIADYYASKRGVPSRNIISIPMPQNETIERATFANIKDQVLSSLDKKGLTRSVKCILTLYGTPLKLNAVTGPKSKVRFLESEIDNLNAALAVHKKRKDDKKAKAVNRMISARKKELKALQVTQSEASFDSELSLLFWNDYPTERGILNPLHYYYSQRGLKSAGSVQRVIMVSRLDGPFHKDVIRMIDDAIEVEKGPPLEGTVYMDAMGKRGRAYDAYNDSLKKCSDFFEQRTSLNVVLENTPDVFPEGSAPDAVFYCGWYSLAKYVPAFTWKKGSVGYHLASVEARSLRKGNEWCKRMIEEGVTATLGPVGEPYINAFPLPSEFFYFLTAGKYTLVEAYYKSLPFLSWKMVLIGDPLYKPPVKLRKGHFESLLRAKGF